MSGLQLLALAGAFVVGIGAGAWGYRYALKKDPEALERLAQAAKRAGDAAKARLK